MIRRAFLLAALALCFAGTIPAAWAASPAETFVSDKIQAGLTILNNTGLTTAQRKAQFADFLLSVTDMKRVALYTLGNTTASDADKDAFVAAFQDYAIAVYQSYFTLYNGQGLTVIGSKQRAPGDFIVTARILPAPGAEQKPLDVDLRIRTDGPKPVLVDFSVAGMFMAVAQHDQFAAFLNQNKNSVPALTAHLRDITAKY